MNKDQHAALYGDMGPAYGYCASGDGCHEWVAGMMYVEPGDVPRVAAIRAVVCEVCDTAYQEVLA